jgi:chorismate mutase/prephenate dehydratase
MSDIPSDLDQLRRSIDEIDDRLQDLLIERIGVVSRIDAFKHGSDGVAAHQPAREAEIIRRLVERNRGRFPPATLVRMWRELLAATVRQQSAFAVAVYAPPTAPGYWDLARDHYGSLTAMTAHPSTAQVVRAVIDDRAAIGVLPMPQDGDADPDPWWLHLLSAPERAPQVIARLPFGSRGNARSDGAAALAIGRGTRQPTGRDRTLIVIENAPDISRDRIVSTLKAAGLTGTILALYEQAQAAHTLIEIAGFVALDDHRLATFKAQVIPTLQRILLLGGYAGPFAEEDLKP